MTFTEKNQCPGKTLQTNPGGEGQIQLTLLLQLCDDVAPIFLVLSASVRKADLFGYILGIQNIFYLSIAVQ